MQAFSPSSQRLTKQVAMLYLCTTQIMNNPRPIKLIGTHLTKDPSQYQSFIVLSFSHFWAFNYGSRVFGDHQADVYLETRPFECPDAANDVHDTDEKAQLFKSATITSKVANFSCLTGRNPISRLLSSFESWCSLDFQNVSFHLKSPRILSYLMSQGSPMHKEVSLSSNAMMTQQGSSLQSKIASTRATQITAKYFPSGALALANSTMVVHALECLSKGWAGYIF